MSRALKRAERVVKLRERMQQIATLSHTRIPDDLGETLRREYHRRRADEIERIILAGAESSMVEYWEAVVDALRSIARRAIRDSELEGP